MKKIHFGRVFAIAAASSFVLSLLLPIGMELILGVLGLLYLFGLILVGLFSRSFKPYADEARPESESGSEERRTPPAEHA